MVEFFKTVEEWCLGRRDIMLDYVMNRQIPGGATGRAIIGKRQRRIRSQLTSDKIWPRSSDCFELVPCILVFRFQLAISA